MTIEEHNVDPNTHKNIILDGNDSVPIASKKTLAEHEVDENAHKNIIVDANK